MLQGTRTGGKKQGLKEKPEPWLFRGSGFSSPAHFFPFVQRVCSVLLVIHRAGGPGLETEKEPESECPGSGFRRTGSRPWGRSGLSDLGRQPNQISKQFAHRLLKGGVGRDKRYRSHTGSNDGVLASLDTFQCLAAE